MKRNIDTKEKLIENFIHAVEEWFSHSKEMPKFYFSLCDGDSRLSQSNLSKTELVGMFHMQAHGILMDMATDHASERFEESLRNALAQAADCTGPVLQ